MVESEQPELDIWIIEDDPMFRGLMVDLLRETDGLRCGACFSSCEGALERLKTEFAPEIMLVDIGLPGMSGIDGVRELKKISPTTEFIILTVHEDDEKVFQAICAGATGYLLKSAPSDEIVQKIKEVGEGGSPMDAHIARKVLSMFARLSVPTHDYGLTDREMQILGLLVEGLTKHSVAEKLFVSPGTIHTHVRNIYEKLHVHSRSGAVAKALKEHLI
jgi:DNA-binding NarL/FixJ family response regulator